MTTKLAKSALGVIAATARVPGYDLAGLSAGIMHFGIGNFHRAHQAVYLDDLFATGRDHDWGILGAGVQPSDEAMRQTLAAQDYLTTVVEQEAESSTARVIAPLLDFLPPSDIAGMIVKLADPAIRIVSLTITEGGYFVDPATGQFDPAHPAIAADAADPAHPKTVFGIIVAGLQSRRAAGIVPFTVMSCDNVPHNGVVARRAVAGLARQIEPALADWIEANVAFPNGMVDRITPATGDRERQILAADFAIADAWPVFCEGFRQWVLEDRFSAGRPALEKVGVQFVPDVTPYELMKIRILNGGHAIIAYAGGLLDIHFVHEAMAHPLVRGFLDKIEQEEIIPVLPKMPGTDFHEYYQVIVRRFANPKIGDTIRRLCFDGSNRQPKFIVPSIADRLRAGAEVTGLAMESALWCRYCFGTSDSGAVIAPNDPIWDRLQTVARRARDEPLVWLGMADIYGDSGQSPAFRSAFSDALRGLWTNGTAATLSAYVNAAP